MNFLIKYDKKNDLFPNLEEIKEKAKQELQIKVNIRKEKYLKNAESFDPEANFIEKNKETSIKPLPWDISQDSFCFKCSKIKPPRVHHCKECRTFEFIQFFVIL